MNTTTGKSANHGSPHAHTHVHPPLHHPNSRTTRHRTTPSEQRRMTEVREKRLSQDTLSRFRLVSFLMVVFGRQQLVRLRVYVSSARPAPAPSSSAAHATSYSGTRGNAGLRNMCCTPLYADVHTRAGLLIYRVGGRRCLFTPLARRGVIVADSRNDHSAVVLGEFDCRLFLYRRFGFVYIRR